MPFHLIFFLLNWVFVPRVGLFGCVGWSSWYSDAPGLKFFFWYVWKRRGEGLWGYVVSGFVAAALDKAVVSVFAIVVAFVVAVSSFVSSP